jgi:hypothetical protein
LREKYIQNIIRHQKREAEPVDNPLWSGPKPNLHQSTYNILQQNIPTTVI